MRKCQEKDAYGRQNSICKEFEVTLNELRSSEKRSELVEARGVLARADANGVLYTGSFNRVLRAIDATNGNTLFSTDAGNVIGAPITVTEGTVLVGVGIGGPGAVNAYGVPA